MVFYFGAHMPVKDIIKSLQEVQSYGGNMIQIFINNPRSTKRNPKLLLKYESIGEEIKNYCIENDLKIVIHSPYILNFAEPVDLNENSFQILQDELLVSDWLGAIGCVIHMGKQLKMDFDEATENMKQSMKRLAKYCKDNNLKSKVIMETVAGQGSEMFATVSNSLSPLLVFYNLFTDAEKRYLKLCFDTCHIFAAGYDIRTPSQIKKLFIQLKENNIIQHIVLIHFNDSKKEYGSKVDRHKEIGYGCIGTQGLASFLKHSYNNDIPCILETPDDAYMAEIPWIKKLINKYSTLKL